MTQKATCLTLLSLSITAATSACIPFGDCWPRVTANIKLNPDIQVDPGVSVVIAGAPRIYDEDVSGIDHQGVPVTPEGLTPFEAANLGPAAREATLEFWGFPYPSWYIAFLDSNGNKTLDPGELFGVDPENPRVGTCAAYTVAIEINSIRVEAHEEEPRGLTSR